MAEIEISIFVLISIIIISVVAPAAIIFFAYKNFRMKENHDKDFVIDEVIMTLLKGSETMDYQDVKVRILANDSDWCHIERFDNILSSLCKKGLSGFIRMKKEDSHAKTWYEDRHIKSLGKFSGNEHDVKMVTVNHKGIFFSKLGERYKIKQITNENIIREAERKFDSDSVEDHKKLNELIVNQVNNVV